MNAAYQATNLLVRLGLSLEHPFILLFQLAELGARIPQMLTYMRMVVSVLLGHQETGFGFVENLLASDNPERCFCGLGLGLWRDDVPRPKR